MNLSAPIFNLGKKMLLFILLSIASCISFAQSSLQTVDPNELVAIEYKESVPAFFRGFVGEDTTTMRVYYYKDMIMYRLSYNFGSSYSVPRSDPTIDRSDDPDGTDTIYSNDTMIKTCDEKRFHFVVFKKGERYGYNYNPYDSVIFIQSGWKLLDSVLALKYQLEKGNYMDSVFLASNAILISSKNDPGSGEPELVYEFREKGDSIKLSTLRYRFNKKLKAIDVSISPRFDSIYNSKVNEAWITTYKAALSKCCFPVDGDIETYYSISTMTVWNREEVMGYFKRFEEDRKRYTIK